MHPAIYSPNNTTITMCNTLFSEKYKAGSGDQNSIRIPLKQIIFQEDETR